MSIILGITGGLSHTGQDASVAIIQNSELVFAMEEERFTRQKHSRGVMPTNAITKGLNFIQKSIKDVEYVAYYANYFKIKDDLVRYFKHNFGYSPKILFYDHHMCHAASAFFPSKFEKSLIFTADYSGDGVSTTVSIGNGKNIETVKRYKKPNSLGIFYSMFTQILGFEFDNDEYKVMGLAPYGKNKIDLNKFIQTDRSGDYKLNYKYLNLNNRSRQDTLYNDKFISELNLSSKFKYNNITQKQKDIAFSVQSKLEEIIVNLIINFQKKYKINNLCMAGGVSLNCAVVRKISQLNIFKNIFVQPASSDAGAALGAAILANIEKFNKFKKVKNHVYLGNQYNKNEIKYFLKKCNIKYTKLNQNNLKNFISEKISKDFVFGIFKGRHEYGPRALGNRSILANPKNKNMKSILNHKIKFREGFRPFAPVVMQKNASKFFDLRLSPENYKHMTINVSSFEKTKKYFPSCVHVDGTSRVQILNKKDNVFIYEILSCLDRDFDINCLINTSFNLNKMPIVNTPQDALSCFFGSGLDYLVLEDYLIEKN